MRVWRIAASRHAALDGEGARLFGSRWTPPGRAVVFASESLSLAALERLVHTDPDLPGHDLVAITIVLPSALAATHIGPDDLPDDWRDLPATVALARVGVAWLEAGETAALWVPSVVIPSERNVILAPQHRDFTGIEVAAIEPFTLDPRLVGRRR
jgi:RES domain-containing protein